MLGWEYECRRFSTSLSYNVMCHKLTGVGVTTCGSHCCKCWSAAGERRRGVEEEGSEREWEALEPILEHSLSVLHGLSDR